jgi:hypothetical protein
VAERIIVEGGAVRLVGDGCARLVTRLRPGIVMVRIAGYDKGELGNAPFDEILNEIHHLAKLFSCTGDLVQRYSSRELFEEVVQRTLAR